MGDMVRNGLLHKAHIVIFIIPDSYDVCVFCCPGICFKSFFFIIKIDFFKFVKDNHIGIFLFWTTVHKTSYKTLPKYSPFRLEETCKFIICIP